MNINRDISYGRIPKITNYIDNMDNKIGIFFPALVFSFRDNPINYYSNDFELNISINNKLVVIDGQHRIKAIEKFLEKNQNNNKRERIEETSLTVQIYFGLNIQDEKHLFADINSNSKKVSMSLITKFDNRDVLNVLVTELHNICDALQSAKIEFNKSRLQRPGNDYFSTSSRLKELVSILLFGKKSPNKKDSRNLIAQYDDVLIFLDKLFRELFSSLPPQPGDVLKSILGHYATQQSIGYYIYNSIMLNETDIQWITDWEEEIDALANIDWSIKNPVWKKYLNATRKNTPSEYLQIEEYKADEIYEEIKKQLNY
nr:DNA sulfur modification protein DndB [Halalkalibacter hemicellulosilyticus]